jgi:hypothetical protein
MWSLLTAILLAGGAVSLGLEEPERVRAVVY